MSKQRSTSLPWLQAGLFDVTCPDAEENEGGENMQTEEWLAKVAALGRASAALSLPRLAERLAAALTALQQCIQSGVPRGAGCLLLLVCTR